MFDCQQPRAPPLSTPTVGTGLVLVPYHVLRFSACGLEVTDIAHLPDDFLARSSDELSLAKRDRVELIERDDEFGDGWFLGKHLANGNSGLFPEGSYHV